MSYAGDFRLASTFDIKFTTVAATGAPTQLAGSPVISAYVGNDLTQLTAGITLSVDFDGVTGLNNVRVVASGANGYLTASNYQLVITTGTVGGVSVVGYVVGTFSIENRSALMPTTAARTLDVTAGGEAGVDWANVGSPTTSLALTGTTIATTQKVDVETIKTNPVVNGGTLTFPTTATLASTTNITAGTVTTATNVTTVNGLASGVITATSIAADAITAAKVADGTIDAATFAAGAITAAAIAADAIGASELAADAVTEIQSGLATSSALSTLQTDVTTLLGRITSGLFTGITSLAQWLGLLAGKQTGNSTARTEVRATGAGSGTFDETTDSQEALRDNVGTNGAALALAKTTNVTGFNDLSAAQVNAEADTALADVGLTTTITGRIDAAISTRLASAGYTAPLDAAGTRTAVGLASANLDTQLSTIDDFLDTEIAAIKLKTDLIPAAPAAVGDVPTATQNADALLKRDMSAVTGEAARSPLNALRFLRNKWAIAGGTLSVKKEDDTTDAWTATATQTAGDPVSEIDPA